MMVWPSLLDSKKWMLTEQGLALRQFLDAHGSIKHDVPKDGCCLFQSVGYLVKIAKRPVHAHKALRDVATHTPELNTDGFHTVWGWKFAKWHDC